MCTLGVSVTGVLGRSSSFSEFTGYVSFSFSATADLPATIPLLVFTTTSGSHTNQKKRDRLTDRYATRKEQKTTQKENNYRRKRPTKIKKKSKKVNQTYAVSVNRLHQLLVTNPTPYSISHYIEVKKKLTHGARASFGCSPNGKRGFYH